MPGPEITLFVLLLLEVLCSEFAPLGVLHFPRKETLTLLPNPIQKLLHSNLRLVKGHIAVPD